MNELLIDISERQKRRYIQKACSPGNATLNRRTQPNARGIHHRLGYNTIAATYSPGCEIARLSGSSLNRSYSKLKRDEKRLENEKLEAIRKNIAKQILNSCSPSRRLILYGQLLIVNRNIKENFPSHLLNAATRYTSLVSDRKEKSGIRQPLSIDASEKIKLSSPLHLSTNSPTQLQLEF